jgi:hypothetical protein
MFAFLLLSLLLVASHASVTVWTGAGANSSFVDPNNWSNGVPNANSIVFINGTSCNTSSNCSPDMDIPQLTVSEFHVSGDSNGYGFTLNIIGNLTVTSRLVIGTPTNGNL